MYLDSMNNRFFIIEESKSETLDLSRRGLKKIEKAPGEDSKTIINLVLDQNELQRLDNIETYNRVENVSIIFLVKFFRRNFFCLYLTVCIHSCYSFACYLVQAFQT